MPRPRRVRFSILLTDPDLARWEALAKQLRLNLEQLVRESVELAYARGATR